MKLQSAKSARAEARRAFVAARACPLARAVAPVAASRALSTAAPRRGVAMAAAATANGAATASQKVMEGQARPIFPFTAIVGQEEMKLALILNVIDPKIGGVMIMGDRGTGKSTTIRALADLLPEMRVVANDPFNSDPEDPEFMSEEVRLKLKAGESLPVGSKKIPMVDLPLGATEDRVCGTIDIEKALTEGVKAFEPGLLAKANRGILYVDEVNLLDDHLVDVLLDSAASGWNTVEREGISSTYSMPRLALASSPGSKALTPSVSAFSMSTCRWARRRTACAARSTSRRR